MILIADSGSTKTDWRLISADGNIEQYKSLGINPYHQKEEEIKGVVSELLKSGIPGPVDQLFFYGAGCSSKENKTLLQRVFKASFPDTRVHIDHDLLGAARSLCGHDAGIAGILGTGANSCLYDGQGIILNVRPLGYMMGDEGSGAWLGKQLLTLFMREELSPDIAAKLEKRFDIDKDIILENIYQKPMPNRYMAGFSKFIFQNIRHPQLYQLVYSGFEKFFAKNVEKYNNYKDLPVHFTGSVAFYYSNILRQVANDRGIFVKNIVESPIAGLTLYHQE